MAASTIDIEPGPEVIRQAAMWQAQLADEDCPEHERAAFRAWIDAHETHRTAFERMSGLLADAEPHGRTGRAAVETLIRRRARSGLYLSLALLGSTAALGGFFMRDLPIIRAPLAARHTGVGEVSITALPDQDRITLDTNSAADVEGRVIRLWRGAVMAEVTPGLDRPFVVRTGHGTARALGTRFSVRTDGASTTVTVLESRVQACARSRPETCVVLSPGQSARLDAKGVHRLSDIDPAIEDGWTRGLLFVDDRPLVEVLAELNRYQDPPVRYAPDDLADLKLSGAVSLTDLERALATIESALPVEARRTPEGVVIRRR